MQKNKTVAYLCPRSGAILVAPRAAHVTRRLLHAQVCEVMAMRWLKRLVPTRNLMGQTLDRLGSRLLIISLPVHLTSMTSEVRATWRPAPDI